VTSVFTVCESVCYVNEFSYCLWFDPSHLFN
jgi:hypothetical protein